MVKVKSVVTAAMMLCAAAAMANNFRVADQVYVPAAAHFAGASGTFITDVFISNLTTDNVSISVIYATGFGGSQTNFNNLLTLGPNERRDLIDFFALPQSQGGLGLSSGFGQLIFNACKAGGDCSATCPQGVACGSCPDFRNISVETRIYAIPPGTTLAQNPPTTGQLFSGLPWYSFASSDEVGTGLDKVFITGLRNNGPGAGTYRGNIGLVNASQFSNTTLVVKLFDGRTGNQLGTSFTQALSPLGQVQPSLSQMFPSFTGSTATSAYITVEQTLTTAVNPSDPCCGSSFNGCPAFFAYGSVLDNVSGDATTLEPQFLKALSDAAITCIYSPSFANCKAGQSIKRSVKH
jgi:hypothetical protein